MGWIAADSDPCFRQRGQGDNYRLLVLYVDDCLIESKTESSYDRPGVNWGPGQRSSIMVQ